MQSMISGSFESLPYAKNLERLSRKQSNNRATDQSGTVDVIKTSLLTRCERKATNEKVVRCLHPPEIAVPRLSSWTGDPNTAFVDGHGGQRWPAPSFAGRNHDVLPLAITHSKTVADTPSW